MFVLRLIGSLFEWVWLQVTRLLCPFRWEDDRFENSWRSIPDVENRPSLTDLQPSLTFDFDEFALLHVSAALKLCAFYFIGYLVIAVISFSFVFEQWSVIDSLYFSVVLLTTIGYGDIDPSNDTTRLFLIWFSLYGVAILGIFWGFVGHLVVEMHRKIVDQLEAVSAKRTLKAIAEDVAVTEIAPTVQPHTLTHDVLHLIFLESPIILLVLILALIMGYFEGWTIIQSIYFAVISITTIGFGDIAPEKEGTRLFAVLFLPISVCVFGEVIGRIAHLYISRKTRRMEKKFLSRCITQLDLQIMDADKNGMVSMDEFLAFMLVALQKVDKETIDELRVLFKSLDVTQNGSLDKDDLIQMANSRVGWSSMQSVRDAGVSAE